MARTNIGWVAQVSILRPGYFGRTISEEKPRSQNRDLGHPLTHCLAPTLFVWQRLSLEAPPSPLSSRPERTRISYFAADARTTGAVFRKGNRMKLINATALNWKSGVAQWRDLQFG